METMVATVLIVIIFLMASTVMNTLYSSTVKNSSQLISARLNELEYQWNNGFIASSYVEEFNDWEITIENIPTEGTVYMQLEAIHIKTNQKQNRILGTNEIQ